MPEATFDQISAMHNNPMRMYIALTARQITAIGHIVVQWSILDDQLQKHVDLWQKLPGIPEAFASQKIDKAFWLLLAESWLKLAQDRDNTSNSDLRDAG